MPDSQNQPGIARIPNSWVAIAGFVVVTVTSVVTVTNALSGRLVALETRVPMLEVALNTLMTQNTLQQTTIDELKVSGVRMSGDLSMIRAFVERMERRMDSPTARERDRDRNPNYPFPAPGIDEGRK